MDEPGLKLRKALMLQVYRDGPWFMMVQIMNFQLQSGVKAIYIQWKPCFEFSILLFAAEPPGETVGTP